MIAPHHPDCLEGSHTVKQSCTGRKFIVLIATLQRGKRSRPTVWINANRRVPSGLTYYTRSFDHELVFVPLPDSHAVRYSRGSAFVDTMHYDLIVIGAGAAGLNVAIPAAKLGIKTMLVEKDPQNLGGECLNTGCVPSKALLHIAKKKHEAEQLAPLGITTQGSLDFKKTLSYVRDAQEKIRRREGASALTDLGIVLKFGAARFVAKDLIEVEGVCHSARCFVIATGSKPRLPSITGFNKVACLTNENLFQLEDLPRKLLILGGGPIGVEMAQAFARLGSEVTLVEMGQRLLLRDPKEASTLIQRRLADEGVEILLNTRIQSFPSANIASLAYKDSLSEKAFDRILVAIGKDLDYSELDLEKAEIVLQNGRIKLDPYLRTTNKRVYASGDATGHCYLTHATELHANVILWNLFSPMKRKIDYDNLSWVTFTDPEVATFGLSEQELRKRGVSYRKVTQSFEDVSRATTDHYPESKLVIHLKGEQILGGTMVAPNAGELFQELVLARQNRIPIRKLLEKIYAYPTATRINRWFAIWEYDRKITNSVRKILQSSFRLMH